MSDIKIYVFDNSTGIEIPKTVNGYPVNLVFGSTIEDVHNSIDTCDLFCVFTPIADSDIIVQSNDHLNMMKSVLAFGNKKYTVDCKESSIWYSDKAETNIIISNTVKLPSTELEAILNLYISNIITKKKVDARTAKPPEIYTVLNVRNSKVNLRTPDLNEAKAICNGNLCCVVLNRENQIVYKSTFGKAKIPYKREQFTKVYKSKQKNNNGVFGISLDV